MGEGVMYGLVKRPTLGFDPGRDEYELRRSEDGETEVLAAGRGLSMRLHIVTYLREVAALDGPDGPAALAALKQGWATVRPT